MIYLMLDKDDITKVCGEISDKQLYEELNFNSNQLQNYLSVGKLFRDTYVLVEKSFQASRPKSKKIFESEYGKQYYATSDGKVYVIYKNGKKKYLEGYIKGDKFCVKFGNRNHVVKNLIASLFIEEYKPGDVVILRKKNDLKNVGIDNSIVIDKAKYAKMTGPMSRSQKVGLFENGKCIRTFRSAREAGRKMFCSYQMISDICNDKYKTKEWDMRWM